MLKRLLFILSIACCCYLPAVSQHFVYDLDAQIFFDNREYHNPLDSSQTILGTRLSPEIGVSFRDSLRGEHRLMGGVQYIQPMNGSFHDAVLMPTIYYHYKTPHFNFLFGSFPVKYMRKALPGVLLDDSLSYFSPNLRGALMRYAGKLGYIEAACDWYSMKTQEHPYEAFRLMLNGELQYRWLYAGAYLTSGHYTQPMPNHSKIRVCDNLVINPYVGVNLSSITPLDTLQLQCGYLYTMSRDRYQYDVMTGYGVMLDFQAAKTFCKRHAVGLKNTFFYSDNFMPMYYRFGVNLYRGHPFYRAKWYNRTELSADIVKFDFVDLRFSWVFHYVLGWKVGHQQMVTLDFHLDELPKVKKHNSK